MRTTIDIDDVLLKRLRDEAHAEGMPFRALLHRVLQRGLDAAPSEPAVTYQLAPAPLGRVREGIDLLKAMHVAAALEDEAVVRKLDERR